MTDRRWPNFTPEEMRCKDGSEGMDPAFMDRLQALRTEWGKPMTITSAYRSPAYNASVSSTGAAGPHTTGRAVDIACTNSADRFRLAEMAMRHGFTGVGIAKGFVHLDDLAGPAYPRPALWLY